MAMTETIRGNGTSFMSEVAKLMPSLRAFANFLYRNEESAADLTQETLAKAWQSRSSFVPGTNLRAWLFTIMHNRFRSEMRRAKRQMPWNQELAENIPAPAAEQLWMVELKDAIRAIRSLSKRQRDALLLHGIGGLSSDEAGAIVNCRPTALKSRTSRARQAVVSMIEGAAPLRTRRNRRKDEHAVEELFEQLHELTASAKPATASGHSAGAA